VALRFAMTPGGPISSHDDVPLLFRYFWALAVLVTALNGGIWWYRGRSHRERDPSLVDGYRSLVTGFVGWGSIPWFVMGAGMVFGGVRSPFSYFDLRSPSLSVSAFLLSVVALWVAGTYWIFARDGAEKLVKHPGLFQPQMSAKGIKLVWLAGLAGGIIAVVMMLSGRVPPAPPF
jgi:hypothetical protein